MKKEKTKLTVLLGVLLIAVVITVGSSFAVWQITITQKTTNTITTGCFRFTLTDKNPISIDRAYPITDEEGKALIPYEFTLTNSCSGTANYEINLEVLETSTLANFQYIKYMLNEKNESGASALLSSKDSITPNLPIEPGDPTAKQAYKLINGEIAGNTSKTYELRLWLDDTTPAIDQFMSKTMLSKVTVTTALNNENTPLVPDTP